MKPLIAIYINGKRFRINWKWLIKGFFKILWKTIIIIFKLILTYLYIVLPPLFLFWLMFGNQNSLRVLVFAIACLMWVPTSVSANGANWIWKK